MRDLLYYYFLQFCVQLHQCVSVVSVTVVSVTVVPIITVVGWAMPYILWFLRPYFLIVGFVVAYSSIYTVRVVQYIHDCVLHASLFVAYSLGDRRSFIPAVTLAMMTSGPLCRWSFLPVEPLVFVILLSMHWGLNESRKKAVFESLHTLLSPAAILGLIGYAQSTSLLGTGNIPLAYITLASVKPSLHGRGNAKCVLLSLILSLPLLLRSSLAISLVASLLIALRPSLPGPNGPRTSFDDSQGDDDVFEDENMEPVVATARPASPVTPTVTPDLIPPATPDREPRGIGAPQHTGSGHIEILADGLCLYHCFACALGIVA